jgi:flavin-dependent dehydrogenase
LTRSIQNRKSVEDEPRDLNIVIVGLGVAGSYIASRLSGEHRVVVFERFRRESFDAACAWGTAKAGISKYAKDCGLNFDDYVTHTGREMLVNVNGEIVNVGLRGLCCFDKIRFITDMAAGQDVRFGKYITKDSLESDSDMVIDATGLIRPLLPKIKNDLLVPCVQYRVKYKEPPFDDFYIKPFPNLAGYFWYFPLGDGLYHVGAGDYNRRHNEEIDSFLKRYPGEIVKKNGRPVRITPPRLCEPFFDGKIVGVGESIGTVHPMLGEGIIPSLQCAEMLVDNLDDLSSYRKDVLEQFDIFDLIYRFIRSKIEGEFSLTSNFHSLWTIYRYMKTREDRFGMNVRMRQIMKIVLGT